MAGPRQARHDRQVGCAEGPRRRPGPEGPPAWSGLDRRPLQPHAGAGPVRLLDWRAATCVSRWSMPARCGSSTSDLKVIAESANGQAVAGHLHGRPRPRGRAVHRRSLRRHAGAGSVRVLEGRGRRAGCRGRHARDHDRRQRSGNHDCRQGQLAHERDGDVPHRRRAEGGQLDGRRPPGAVPRDAVGAACRRRRTRTRCVPDATRTRSLRRSSRQCVAARASWVWKSFRSVSGT